MATNPATRLWVTAITGFVIFCAAALFVVGFPSISPGDAATYWFAPFTLAPIYLTFRTYKVYHARVEDERRHLQETSELHLATIEALARAIDAKDQTADTHIRRVQFYASTLARVAGLSDAEIQGVKTAALLHDIGKLAVPEHILSKPGPLTQEEFQKVRIHPQVGAEIISAVPFPYPVAPIILSHHERWDGKGYPQGLSGQDIPIGARVLTIVDYFDAITTQRPYHKALALDGAAKLLQHEAGRALDPNLVPLFVDLLPSLLAETSIAESRERTPGSAGALTSSPAGLTPEAMAPSAFENIALAHREIYALYEIAQTMGTSLNIADTMALISAKLSNVIPWSACTLFIYEQETDSLKCRFAAGVDVPRLLGLSLPSGKGLAGIVARTRQSLVNADPSVTFISIGLEDDTQLTSALICPLFSGDAFIGALSLYRVDTRRFSEDHRRLLEQIAEQAGPVVQNAILFEHTQEDSLTDPLTGLPNRRSLFAHLEREISRASRLQNELALIVIDVDEFKSINDTFGHHVGDRALRAVAKELQAGLRPYDLCVRYAGDEFIVVLTDCPREAAEAKQRELQRRVAALPFEVAPDRPLQLGVSAGTAVFPHDGTTSETLTADADTRMYANKAQRRGSGSRSLAATPAPLKDADAPDAPGPDRPSV